MVWREPRCHLTDCYFCMTSTVGFSSKSKHTIQNPNIPSALRPVCHNDTLPIPEPPNTYTLEPEIDLKDSEPPPGASNDTFNDDEGYSADLVSREPHLLTQSELNDLVRDLQLPKTKSELLGSRLQQWNLLEKGVKISSYRTSKQP
ncbi:hypothetical protein RN001_008769 [Aquatica leii]|uniref:Uncharacterized protein n=1 Tax=Aquatica leii TaxID=1421715 RepID=A0AAN7QJ82_9COLE|nr:hypothetical protein RN001_008769 [Aquatica leii]